MLTLSILHPISYVDEVNFEMPITGGDYEDRHIKWKPKR